MNDKKKAPPVARKNPSPSPGAAPGAEAHRRAAVVLEVLAGVRTPSEAAAALKVSVNYYYLVERQAVGGLVAACEPRPKGKRPDHHRQLAALEQALQRSQRDCQRQAALVRATQRAVGLPVTPAPDAAADKKTSRGKKGQAAARRRRPTSVRALRLARTLKEKAVAKNGADSVEPTAEATGDRSLSANQDQSHDTSGT